MCIAFLDQTLNASWFHSQKVWIDRVIISYIKDNSPCLIGRSGLVCVCQVGRRNHDCIRLSKFLLILRVKTEK